MNLNQKIKKEFSGKNTTLLQGPVGNFFFLLAKKLRKFDCKVNKINFNGGDFIFFPSGQKCKVERENLAEFYEDFFKKNETQILIMYNDLRFVHKTALKIALKLGIDAWIFEEGYLRPYCITFEKNGVNFASQVPRNKEFYLKNSAKFKKEIKNQKINKIDKTFRFMAFYAAIYWLFGFFLAPFFNNSLHHRRLNPLEFIFWIKSLYLKIIHKFSEKSVKNKLEKHKKHFFIAILQIFNDTQIINHYDKNIEGFIAEVLSSFAKNASLKQILVFKHHPMDRGYKNYSKFIALKAQELGISKRVFYICDINLPFLLKNAAGCVCINSTVGLSAILNGLPTKVLGRAFYDFEGMSFGGSLDEFWKNYHKKRPNSRLTHAFCDYILNENQINGNFYENSFLNEIEK